MKCWTFEQTAICPGIRNEAERDRHVAAVEQEMLDRSASFKFMRNASAKSIVVQELRHVWKHLIERNATGPACSRIHMNVLHHAARQREL